MPEPGTLAARPEFVPGIPLPLRQGVRRLVAPNAGLMTGPGTNTYLLGERDITVLDPGPLDLAHLQAILAAAQAPIRCIIVTHTHRDHSPLAALLAARTGARLVGLLPPDDGRQDESFKPDHAPLDGEKLHLGEMELTAIRTPGHASNCICYLLEKEKLLFTGDHVLEGVSPVILPPDGDMGAYMHSLDKLAPYDFEQIAPGHGGVMAQGKRTIALLRAHRVAREGKVLKSLAELGAATLEALTPVVYDDVAPERHAWAKLTLEAHLIKLGREERVCRHGDSWRISSA